MQLPLTVPTIKDRVVQTAVMLVLEPIFEADLPPEQYAYRTEKARVGRGASTFIGCSTRVIRRWWTRT